MPVHVSLQEAFVRRADGVRSGDRALVGVFGEGLPRPLVAAMGGLAVDIKAPPLADATDGPTVPAVSAVAEPFLDSFATRFLHRFAAGAFDDFATLIFARDDVAALAAYQYAMELRRQGVLPDRGPRLYLWNLLHSDSVPAAAFNASELARLTEHLMQTLGTVLDPEALAHAVTSEAIRADALRALPPGGPEAFVARNAGRWLTPDAHRAVLSDLPQGEGPRIALAGTACDIPLLQEICSEVGQVICDLQDYGRPQPQPTDPADLLFAISRDPLCLRAAPPGRFTKALAEGIKGADLIVSSMDPNDDAFGWELPGLRLAAERQGASFLDLGFRPFRPDAAWQDRARARIAEMLS